MTGFDAILRDLDAMWEAEHRLHGATPLAHVLARAVNYLVETKRMHGPDPLKENTLGAVNTVDRAHALKRQAGEPT